MRSNTINERFVNYYKGCGFRYLTGTSLLHPSIPMSFVMSAGLAEVETAIDHLGKRTPGNNYVLVQNCFRHFDVDRIGKSDLHLSLFQMPGAFSFGHHSRQTIIQRMWDFLTRDLGIASEHLWATFFSGGEVSGHHFGPDLDTSQAWQSIGLPEEHIVGLGPDHNFWKQGGGIDGQEASRKCGPNTELFFDRGTQIGCGPTCCPGCGCGRFVEFSNSLFIFAKIHAKTNNLSLMAEPFTETVIGTERVAMILEDKPTVFEIETVKPLIGELRSFYASKKKRADMSFDILESERILVDHLRALVHLAADNAPPPGKGGRRRLMRILIRRVLAHLKVLQVDILPCLDTLINLIVAQSTHSTPNLNKGRAKLLEYIEMESCVFDRTLSRGYRQLDRLLASNNGYTLDGGELVRLVKQYGVPVPLLRVTLAQKGVEFKEREYSKAFEQWRRDVLTSSVTAR